MISRLPVRARARRYAISVSSRLALWAVATPVAVAVTLGLVESNVLAAALMAVAGTTAGLSAAWFYIGLRRPWTLIFAEVAPRVVFTLLAIVLMHAGLPLLWYPSLLIAAAAAAPAIGWRVSGANRRDVRGWNPRRMWFVVRFQSNGLAARVLSSAYIALPLPIVAIVNPAAVPDFAAIERLQRLVLAAAAALPSLFQHWVGSSTSPSERDKRAKATVAAGVLFGGLTGVAYFFAAPWMAGLLFSGKLSIPDIGWALSAILIAIVIVSRMTGAIALVNARRIRAITWSAVAGAIAGPIAIATLAMHFGALGAVGGEIVAEAAVLIVQLIALMTIWYWPRTGGRRVRRGEGN